jgi:molybdopterin molybdotransferase
MWDFEEARTCVISVARSGPAPRQERVLLGQAAGRVLAETVVSPVQVPASDYSAMDGYAVSTADFAEGGEKRLVLAGECRAGHPSVNVSAGTCVRIFTGAHIPPGADAVVMQENVFANGHTVTFPERPKLGDHIRRSGEDLQVGQDVLKSGTRLTGFHLGLLASVERTEVSVAVRPQVVIVCTGDELRPPGSSFGSGTLAESNSVALGALIESAGGRAVRAPIVKDQLAEMKAALLAAKRGADVIVTVGGVSVGDHDVVEPALVELGAEICFHKVKMRPGKPVLFARWGEVLVLGLPGNPSSAQVTFSLFGYPLLRALQGDAFPLPQQRRAALRQSFGQKPGRVGFYRAHLQDGAAEILGNQASGASTSMAWANALAVVGENQEVISAGEEVRLIAYADL